MKKKSALITCGIFGAIALLSVPTLVGAGAFLLPAVYEDTFLGEMKEKIKLLKETDGKRIVLIGGSSLPFGINSELIERNIHDYKVVNFGMYATLGSNVMLDFAKARINEGDIVVFMPEQNPQTLSMYYNGASLWQVLDGDFSNMSYLPRATRERLLGDMYAFAESKYQYNFASHIDLDYLYQKANFDEHGEIYRDLLPYNVMPELYDPSVHIEYNERVIRPDFIRYVNDFASYVRGKGANLYYHFGPSNREAVTREGEINQYYDFLKERFNFDILGDPNASIMDKEWFFDTNYHLNNAGSTVFTKTLVKDLKNLLGDNSPTNIQDPVKPKVPANINTKDGDNSDDAYFAYTALDEVLEISSMVEEKTKMVVPYRHRTKLVTKFAKETFAGHTKVEDITLQDNITSIQDGSFAGCTNLKKIHLKNEDPTLTKVGAHLLEGTNAYLYVPSKSYSKYVTSYIFAPYAERIKAE